LRKLDGERAFGSRLRNRIAAAQLAGEGRHREKIGIAGVAGFEATHMCEEARTHVLLAEDVIEELSEFRGA
jgi:hypothetical protein